MDRTILHCDLNSFFASVELLEHPELQQCPVAVCGDPAIRHGIILAKNEPAKHFQVQTAETIWQARRKCPDLVLLPAHHEKYTHFSKVINAIYGRYTDLVEPFSIDESWLDVSGSMHLFGGDGKHVADTLRRVVREETGLTISIGVSFNKIFAKMGSDYKKPDATTVITRENYRDMLWPLPVGNLLFVGKAAVKLLNAYGIYTIGDLARADCAALTVLLGKQGRMLHNYATGAEAEPVISARDLPPPKSVGNGITFRRNLLGWDDIHTGIITLADSVAARLRQEHLKCNTVQVTIRDPNFKDISRQKRLEMPTYLSRDIAAAALELMQSAWNSSAPIRALSVTGQNLVDEGETNEQLSLFAAESAPRRARLERLEKTMDRIRDKYGKDAISFATPLKAEIGVEEKKGG